MKKIIMAAFAIVIFCANSALAYNVNQMTDDSKIASALSVLDSANQKDVLQRLDKTKTQIIFYDLTLLSYSYAKHYAIASTDETGTNYILINQNLRKSPKEALACLIAHESVHQLPQATFEEELRATTTEARTWMLLKDRVSSDYNQDTLVTRLNKLAVMYQASSTNNNLIEKSIANNSFYQNQLAQN
ncbi:MAG: hypothetical protein PHV37_09660 [Candidatus Gastranaerophilales bacterium]|nr:hypothetical protein [Candidatus Gastranaerophilales bacterium]